MSECVAGLETNLKVVKDNIKKVWLENRIADKFLV